MPGHSGRLDVRGGPEARVAFLRGRVHGYEGADAGEVGLPVRTLARWGVGHLIVTNASGSLRPGIQPGEAAVVGSVIDCRCTPSDGPPPMVSATPAGLVEVLRRAQAGTDEDGVVWPAQVAYVAVPGPQYETAAEVGVLRALGGDVVGMSTAVELQAAIDEGLETAVLTVVTNAAGVADHGADASAGTAGVADEAVDAPASVHAQVLEVSVGAVPRVGALIRALLTHWHAG